MTKDERLACANHLIIKGLAVLVFGLTWNYFISVHLDAWRAFPSTLAIMGVLCMLYGFYRRSTG